MTDLSSRLKRTALDQGIDLVGIATSGPARSASKLRSWIVAGMHGEMSYMSRTERLRRDPKHLLAGCRSVVAVAMSYRSSLPPSTSWDSADGRAWVSRYAWGRDYHRILKKKLIRLGRWLADQCPGSSWRACVDTAPVLEREWAQRSGIGWIAKNTMLINRRLGSELFLGLLLTDVDLRPDEPVPEHCGRCTACLDACPTKAFVQPGTLDSRKCIAYLTVEHRSPLPDDLTDSAGVMVAGCDICQEVCPWTRRAPVDLHPEFAPHRDRYRPLIADLEGMTEDGYRQWRQGSSLNRIAYAQFVRNVAVARENSQPDGKSPDSTTF